MIILKHKEVKTRIKVKLEAQDCNFQARQINRTVERNKQTRWASVHWVDSGITEIQNQTTQK